ncbi:hypothetical protein BC937DRAFT_94470, partial [Endogone sp. FLAS-F59071]
RGVQWDQNPNWPCRGWYVRLLLGVAALNRIVEWWEAEKGFWSVAEGEFSGESESDGTAFGISVVEDSEDSETVGEIYDPVNKERLSGLGIREGMDGSNETVVQHNKHDNKQLQIAAERGQSMTMVMELTLKDEQLRYLSPVWKDLVGSDPQSLIGTPMSQLVSPDDKLVFTESTKHLLEDDSRTVEIHFTLMGGADGSLEVEGKGMLMYDRVTGQPSHTMWVIKPIGSKRWTFMNAALSAEDTEHALHHVRSAQELVRLSDGLPKRNRKRSNSEPSPAAQLVESDYEEMEQEEPLSVPLQVPPPVLCNICERWIFPSFFEQHSVLCAEINRAEMDVQIRNDQLREMKAQIQTLYDQLLAVEGEPNTKDSDASIKANTFVRETASDENPFLSAFDSPPELKSSNDINLQKANSIAVFKELIEILDVALTISTPGEDSASESISANPIQSPLSESKIVHVLYWRPPTPEDIFLSALVTDVETLVKGKVDVVNRMRDRVAYNEQVRLEYQELMKQEVGWSEFMQAPPSVPIPEQNIQDQRNIVGFVGTANVSDAKFISQVPDSLLEKSSDGDISSQGSENRTPTTTTPVVEPPLSPLSVKRKNRPSHVFISPSIMELETIDTPIPSPGLPPKVISSLSQRSLRPHAKPPTSPAPSLSGTPPEIPDSRSAYLHTYFGLLFDRSRRESASSSAASIDGSGSGTPNVVHNKTPETPSTPLVGNSNPGFFDEVPFHPSSVPHVSGFPLLLNMPSSGVNTPGLFFADRPESERNDATNTCVGTPDYLAPESILGTGQDVMVDWVSHDFLVFEFMR